MAQEKTPKQLREEYIRASDARVSRWSKEQQEAFREAVKRLSDPAPNASPRWLSSS